MNFIGIDVGTTMIKGQLLNEKGLVLFKSSYDSPSYSKDGVSFISCTQSEEIVLNIIKELVEHSTDEVGYICFSSFGEAFALIDKNGKPANDFILFVSNKNFTNLKIFESSFYSFFICRSIWITWT